MYNSMYICMYIYIYIYKHAEQASCTGTDARTRLGRDGVSMRRRARIHAQANVRKHLCGMEIPLTIPCFFSVYMMDIHIP